MVSTPWSVTCRDGCVCVRVFSELFFCFLAESTYFYFYVKVVSMHVNVHKYFKVCSTIIGTSHPCNPGWSTDKTVDSSQSPGFL